MFSRNSHVKELNDDVAPIVAPLSLSSKDSGHSLANRTIFTSGAAVAPTTDNNCQRVSAGLSSVNTASLSLQPLLFNARPPIASLEDLTSGEQNSDSISARSNVATTIVGRNGIRRSDLKGDFF
uniref:Uncharacterized protein n=1 Tax=Elaeophora elaphi TaxID=1147741 RepID=A0A0R3RK06_9BILA